MTTLAFDVYGTLIDTHGVVALLEKFIGKQAQSFSQTWRDKQLEYSFRRGHMQNYVDFSVCTKQALDYTIAYYKVDLSQEQTDELMSIYAKLPAFEDVKGALKQLRTKNYKLFAFSNGKAQAVEKLLTHAGIIEYFDGIISVDDIKTFKPSPAVYAHFLRSAQVNGSDAWLISGNAFDVTGAISAGMKAVWLKRNKDALFDPWEIQPTATVNSLGDLEHTLGQ